MYESDSTRELDEEEQKILENQKLAPEFKRKKLEADARFNWDRFYKRNQANFFKDRNWGAEDVRAACDHMDLSRPIVFLEAGCGVGNMLLPLSTVFPHWKYHAFDFSANAVSLLSDKAKEQGLEVVTCVVDLVSLPSSLPFPPADLVTLIYVLSAISEEKHSLVASNVSSLLSPGGTLIVRDYAINDHAMLRFGRNAKLADRFYARQDGTRVYYFTKEELENRFISAGLRLKACKYLHRRTINREKAVDVPRVFVQAVFIK